MKPHETSLGLSEFQSSIHADLQHARAIEACGPANELRCVPLIVAGEKLLLACVDIAKIVVVARLGQVPGSHSCVRGVLAASGSLFTLIDLGLLMSGEPTKLTIKSRAVCLESNMPGENMAVLVDRALDIRSATQTEAAWVADDADIAAKFAQGCAEMDGERFQCTTAAKLFAVTAEICGAGPAATAGEYTTTKCDL